MKRVLVTGATGFIGRHLVQSLTREKVDVVPALRNVSDYSRTPDGVEPIAFDLTRPELLHARQLRNIDCIFHLAARVHVMQPNGRNEEEFNLLNAHASKVLAERALEAGVRRFVYLSSIKVNGEKNVAGPFRPEHPPAPQDAYGRSKFEAERSLTLLARNRGLEVAIVRPPLVYGPHVGANFRRLLSLVESGVPLPLGAVKNQRSLVNVWNLVSILQCVAQHPRVPESVCMVSDGADVSTPQLLRLAGAALGCKVRLIHIPVPLLRAAGRVLARGAEIDRLVDSLQVDISGTQQMLGWRPRVTLEEGVERTVAWFKEASHARA